MSRSRIEQCITGVRGNLNPTVSRAAGNKRMWNHLHAKPCTVDIGRYRPLGRRCAIKLSLGRKAKSQFQLEKLLENNDDYSLGEEFPLSTL